MVVIFDIDLLEDKIKKELVQVAKKYNLACIFRIEYTEPFLNNTDLYTAVSISDAQDYDNCEMFLLPDGCTHNDEKNKIPFVNRMLALRDFTLILKKSYRSVEWFIGDSGTPYDDFLHLYASPNELPQIMDQYYYDPKTVVESDIHIVVK